MIDEIKVLEQIQGEKKEMYLDILKHLAMGLTELQVGTLFNLSESRISQIYTANRKICDELTMDADLAKKAGRLRYAFRQLNKKGESRSRKDSLDWLEYIRKELEGDKVKLEGSPVNVNVYPDWQTVFTGTNNNDNSYNGNGGNGNPETLPLHAEEGSGSSRLEGKI